MNVKEILSLKSKNLFKILLLGSAGIYVPLGIIASLLAGFDIVPANLNDVEYSGFKGFIIQILFIPFLILIMTLSQALILILGLKTVKFFHLLFSKMRNIG